MSSDKPVVRLEGVGKCYEVYSKPADRLAQMFLGKRKKLYKEFWALQDISFDVYPGDCIGILGANGSGKSTLLQIVSGTLQQTTGTAAVHGRLAALLELGSGFNPEFSGRENVFMNGTVLGFSEREIRERFDAIADFAAIGDFIDQPVKTYSSGMMLRLAFAVQVQVEPSVLVVDEALSVGDARFQLKCLARLEELRRGGTTVLFVSHSIEQVKQLCNRAVLLNQGRMVMQGDPVETGLEYYRILFPPSTHPAPQTPTPGEPKPEMAEAETLAHDATPDHKPSTPARVISTNTAHHYGRGGSHIDRVELRGLDASTTFSGGETLEITVEHRFDIDRVREISLEDEVEPTVYCGIRVDTQQGVVLTDLVTETRGDTRHGLPLSALTERDGRLRLRYRVTLPSVQQGEYFFSPAAAVGGPAGLSPLVEYVHLFSLQCVPSRSVHGLLRLEYDVEELEAI